MLVTKQPGISSRQTSDVARSCSQPRSEQGDLLVRRRPAPDHRDRKGSAICAKAVPSRDSPNAMANMIATGHEGLNRADGVRVGLLGAPDVVMQ